MCSPDAHSIAGPSVISGIARCDIKPSAVFTEHGAVMAANVLNSPRAVQMSVFVVRAFIRMRVMLADTRQLARKLARLERELKGRLDVHEGAIVEILQRVMGILDPPRLPEPKRRRIGFRVEEAGPAYRRRRPAGRGRLRCWRLTGRGFVGRERRKSMQQTTPHARVRRRPARFSLLA